MRVPIPEYRHALAAFLLSSFVFVVPLACASASDDSLEDDEALDRVVVTASRTARSQDETLAAITVIDRTEIERLQPQSLPDLLAGRAGVSLANNGGPGKATSLFLRGTESDHTLVLVDGIKLGSATSGSAALQDIPTEQIERIEIVRGPFSSLYGSEALGGVIQIFTRRPQGTFAPNASVSIGSEGTRRASVGIGGRSRDATQGGWYSVNAAHGSTDGINAFRGPRGFNPDRDGYHNDSLVLQGGYRFNERWDAEARVFRAEGENEYDGTVNNESDSVQQVVGGRVRYAPSDALKFTLNLGSSADLSDNYLNGRYSSTFNTRRRMAGLQADIGAGEGLVTLGFDWQADHVYGSTRYAQDSRRNRGLFAQWQQDFGTQSLQASLRRDEDSQFGGVTTGSALWGWNIGDTLRLAASYGTAYKAPTYNELYFPGYGNPDLQPERSHSLELGLRGDHGTGGWSLSAYETRIDDLIAYDADLRPLPGPNNIDRARIRGFEATGHVRLADWDLRASATWLDPLNDGDNPSHGNVLPRRATRSGRVDVDRRFGDFSAGLSVTGANARYENLANTRRLHGYGLVDLRVAYAFASDWSVQFTASNVFDRRYETAEFYNQPGRQWLLSLRYQPGAR
ncbi:MAG TPA: TonB-dependent vitamin B12 receptor [Xanthomonadaceae bacterium]